jgi:hypothetical protein
MPRKRLFFSLGGGGGGGSRKGGTGFSISTFLGLNDTPSAYATALDILQVNAGKTALEFIPGRGQVNGVASLDASGLVPTAQLPPLAITEFLGVVANQAAMLALSGERGDWCIRSDLSTVWILTTDDPSILANWQEMAYPVDPSKVLIDATDDTPGYMGDKLYSFLGTHSGISIGKLGLNPNQKIELQVAYDDSTINLDGSEQIRVKPLGITDAQVAVANKDGAAGTASMRTIGAGALQACAGNDARLSDARTPLAHAASHYLGGADTITTIPRYIFFADQVLTPNNADWAINSPAGMSADSLNNALLNRQFDDTTEEGIGFLLEIPAGAVSMTFYFRSRAQVAPGGATTVLPRLYRRNIPDNAVVGAWSAAFAFAAINLPTNTRFQYDSETVTLATLGLTAGEVVQFELTRNPADGLVGDWNLLELRIYFD